MIQSNLPLADINTLMREMNRGGRKLRLQKFYDMQLELDQDIYTRHGIEVTEEIIDKKIFAFKVELGECANNAPVFKYWKKDITFKTKVAKAPYMDIDDADFYNPLLDEYVDCWHFLLSIGISREYDRFVKVAEPHKVDDLFCAFKELMDNPLNCSGAYIRVVNLLYGLGIALGFDEKDILNGYLAKNQINYKRQASGY
jgi:dimeric dUTPase (all-alpha-NTP-PPase superfamily)